MSHWTSNAISAAYAAFRPSYPAALFSAVAKRCKQHDLCIDVGCGNGQATTSLLSEFRQVIGIDPSSTQVAHAPAHERSRYVVGGAEEFANVVFSGEHTAAAGSGGERFHKADCVTVAQAIHWFHMPTFMSQVDLALKQQPGAVLAFWSYPLCTITSHPKIDALLKEMDAMLMRDGYWPAERKHVDDHYAQIWVPEYFPEDKWTREVEVFPVVKSMGLDQFVAYLSTMSGVSRYQQQNKEADLLADFRAAALRSVVSEVVDDETTSATPQSLQTPPSADVMLEVVYNMETYFAIRK
ncbi:methyltransferase, putative [Bodo saltans]|uniref:Methyltransferase, putative n=1 Tax=Bodo saltans TaxID=75058 RepID=A0A0S4IST5_BODSA|nr:methyltransferase, putative [Bodo saltans]|eukprot:CUE92207.1 methyltransferase, putative [Bodo saltans]